MNLYSLSARTRRQPTPHGMEKLFHSKVEKNPHIVQDMDKYEQIILYTLMDVTQTS
mgnify:CR=1 FL=1